LITAVIQLPGENDGFFCEISLNESLPWGFDLIEHFKDKWNWDSMACNDVSLPMARCGTIILNSLGPHLDDFGRVQQIDY
jgi:hypothetical protein